MRELEGVLAPHPLHLTDTHVSGINGDELLVYLYVTGKEERGEYLLLYDLLGVSEGRGVEAGVKDGCTRPKGSGWQFCALLRFPASEETCDAVERERRNPGDS